MKDIIAAYVSNNHVSLSELPTLIANVHAAITGLEAPNAARAEDTIAKLTPAQIRKSIGHDAIVSFIDGKPYKTMKRHLTTHGLTPDGYRERYGLPADYPMTAPGYSERRSALAKATGLGQEGRHAKAAARASKKRLSVV